MVGHSADSKGRSRRCRKSRNDSKADSKGSHPAILLLGSAEGAAKTPRERQEEDCGGEKDEISSKNEGDKMITPLQLVHNYLSQTSRTTNKADMT